MNSLMGPSLSPYLRYFGAQGPVAPGLEPEIASALPRPLPWLSQPSHIDAQRTARAQAWIDQQRWNLGCHERPRSEWPMDSLLSEAATRENFLECLHADLMSPHDALRKSALDMGRELLGELVKNPTPALIVTAIALEGIITTHQRWDRQSHDVHRCSLNPDALSFRNHTRNILRSISIPWKIFLAPLKDGSGIWSPEGQLAIEAATALFTYRPQTECEEIRRQVHSLSWTMGHATDSISLPAAVSVLRFWDRLTHAAEGNVFAEPPVEGALCELAKVFDDVSYIEFCVSNFNNPEWQPWIFAFTFLQNKLGRHRWGNDASTLHHKLCALMAKNHGQRLSEAFAADPRFLIDLIGPQDLDLFRMVEPLWTSLSMASLNGSVGYEAIRDFMEWITPVCGPVDALPYAYRMANFSHDIESALVLTHAAKSSGSKELKWMLLSRLSYEILVKVLQHPSSLPQMTKEEIVKRWEVTQIFDRLFEPHQAIPVTEPESFAERVERRPGYPVFAMETMLVAQVIYSYKDMTPEEKSSYRASMTYIPEDAIRDLIVKTLCTWVNDHDDKSAYAQILLWMVGEETLAQVQERWLSLMKAGGFSQFQPMVNLLYEARRMSLVWALRHASQPITWSRLCRMSSNEAQGDVISTRERFQRSLW